MNQNKSDKIVQSYQISPGDYNRGDQFYLIIFINVMQNRVFKTSDRCLSGRGEGGYLYDFKFKLFRTEIGK